MFCCIPWHAICFSLFTVTIHSYQQRTRISEKFRNKIEDDRIFKAKKRKKSSWLAKKSENKEKERCSKNQIDYYTMRKNIKTIVEEQAWELRWDKKKWM